LVSINELHATINTRDINSMYIKSRDKSNINYHP